MVAKSEPTRGDAHGDRYFLRRDQPRKTGAIGMTPRQHKLAAGGRYRKPHWLVVSTPRSGWYGCAGERGPGIAVWLWLAKRPRMAVRGTLHDGGLCVGYALVLARTLSLEHKFSPEISACWDRVTTRPGFTAAKAAQAAQGAREPDLA